MESSKHGIITPQCVDKMLSNNTFLETRIQLLLNGLIFAENLLGVHVQRMLKMSRVYTLAEILSKIFVKNEEKYGTLFTTMVWQINDLVPTYFLLKYIMRSMLARISFGKC